MLSIISGAGPTFEDDAVIRVTIHNNYFNRAGERQPRLRYGKVHSFNNYFDKWTGSYASGASQRSYFLSENNIYESGSSNTRGLYAEPLGTDPEPPTAVKSVGDWKVNNVVIGTLNEQNIFNPSNWYSHTAEMANSELMSKLVNNTGWQTDPTFK